MGFNNGGGGGSLTAASDKYLVGDALTDGSIRTIATNGMFQLQKRVDGVWLTMIESDTDQTVIRDSIKTGVGSFHLGEVHSVGSAGENVIFKNEETGVNWFPFWQGITTDGVTITPPGPRIYQALATSLPVGATAQASGQVDYSFQTTFAGNTSVFSVTLVAGETYNGKLSWSVQYVSTKEIAAFDFDVNVVPGDNIVVPFKYPLDARAGAVVNVTLKKADGVIFKARPSSTQPTLPWRSLAVRVFKDSSSPVDYDATYEYQAGSRSHYYGIPIIAAGNIPAGTAFAWGQSGATWKPDIAGTSFVWRGVWGTSAAYAVNDLVAPSSTAGSLFGCSTAIASSTTSPTNLTGSDAGSWQQRLYGGAVQLMIPPKVTRFTSSGTWTPAPGMKYAIAEVQGGGGSSGTANVIIGGATNCWAVGAGGAGSYAKVMITAAQAGASQAITVGGEAQPFTAAANSTGRTGNTSSIGSLVSCVGGTGGISTGEIATAARVVPSGRAAAPAISGCTLLYSMQGQTGETSSATAASVATYGTLHAGSGGGSPLGSGGTGQITVNAIDTVTTSYITPDGYGTGASGKAGYGNTGVQYVGFPGQQGIVIITEYFQ